MKGRVIIAVFTLGMGVSYWVYATSVADGVRLVVADQLEAVQHTGTSGGACARTEGGAIGMSSGCLKKAYVTGWTFGGLCDSHAGGTVDLFQSRCNASGQLLCMHPVHSRGPEGVLGSLPDRLVTEAVTSGAGLSEGDGFTPGDRVTEDAAWDRLVATDAYNESFAASVDERGNMHVDTAVGETLRQNSNVGEVLWTRSMSTWEYEGAREVVVDSGGNVFTARHTSPTLGDSAVGQSDVPPTANAAVDDAPGVLGVASDGDKACLLTGDVGRAIAGGNFVNGWSGNSTSYSIQSPGGTVSTDARIGFDASTVRRGLLYLVDRIESSGDAHVNGPDAANVRVIPEPATTALIGLGVAALLCRTRRIRRRECT